MILETLKEESDSGHHRQRHDIDNTSCSCYNDDSNSTLISVSDLEKVVGIIPAPPLHQAEELEQQQQPQSPTQPLQQQDEQPNSSLQRQDEQPTENNTSLQQEEQKSTSTVVLTAPSRSTVSFATYVVVHEFTLELGDNPAVSQGCPVRLSQNKIQTKFVDLTLMDKKHAYFRRKRSSAEGSLIIPSHQRLSLLLQLGYKFEDLQAVQKDIYKIKASREQRVHNQTRDKVYEAFVMTSHRLSSLKKNSMKRSQSNRRSITKSNQ